MIFLSFIYQKYEGTTNSTITEIYAEFDLL